MENKQSIVVLGGGFGGLHATKALHKHLKSLKLLSKYRIILLDKNPYHTYTPTLYEVASTSSTIADSCRLQEIATFPIKKIIPSSVEFFQTKINKIKTNEKNIYTDSGTVIEYKYLIVALGAETNYFSIPGLAENSLPMKSLQDALKIREKITRLSDLQKNLQIVIGGAGPTGVELSGEIKQWLCKIPRISQGRCCDEVTLIQGSANILPSFAPKIVAQAVRRLNKLGVKIRTSKRIIKTDKKFVYFTDGEKLPYDIFIWSGGVQPNNIMNQLTTDDKVEVNEFMEICCNGEGVYGIGDCVKVLDKETQEAVPGVARAAINQAHIAAENIIEEIRKKKGSSKTIEPGVFESQDYPYILPIGGKFAIAKIGKIIIKGFPGWVIKGLVEYKYLLSIMSFGKATKSWFRGLWIFIRNNRMG